MTDRRFLILASIFAFPRPVASVMEDLFVNRTHFGYGEYYVYSTTSPLSIALYASLVLALAVVFCSIWISACAQRRFIEDATKKEVLLSTYARVDELLDRFHQEVTESEVLIYDEENPGYPTCEIDDSDNDNASGQSPKQGPPVVDGFYSLTQDDPTLEYNEDMYLEFIPNRKGACSVQGFGKYDTGNVRVSGLVASTGEAYWYEVPCEASPHTPPVVLARGLFSKHDSGNSVFMGQWFHSNGESGGPYRLFSHKVVFPSSNSSSVAESTTMMECSFSGSVLGDMECSFSGSMLGDIDGEETADAQNGEGNPPVIVVVNEDHDGETNMCEGSAASKKELLQLKCNDESGSQGAKSTSSSL